MWVVPVRGGLHACIQCKQVVTKKDVTPAFADLPRDFQERWEAHERDGGAASSAPDASAAVH